MNRIYLDKIEVSSSKIKYQYRIEGEWKQYFNLEEEMYVEYSKDISDVPQSIAAIPFLTNILPISWLCDAEIIVEEIDLNFYNSIFEFKKGYTNMYSMLEFKGKLTSLNFIDNVQIEKMTKNSSVFFSGGVDAFSTLFSHIKEKPTLITLWGADIQLDDHVGWKKVESHIKKVAINYNLDSLFIKSNFRSFINEIKLNDLVLKSNDGWWHGFQCGIGLVGHAAPYAFKENQYRVYIASSYTPEYKGTTASVPQTDGKVRFSNCAIYHDQYEINRQQKVSNIVNYSNSSNEKVDLRVCWRSNGGNNCCSCEKCYRTVMGLIAENANPNEFGFDFNESDRKRMIIDLKYKINIDKNTTLPFWNDIQYKFILCKDKNIFASDYKWFLKKDLNKINYSLIKFSRNIFSKGKIFLKRQIIS